MKKSNFLFPAVAIILFICACRKENHINENQLDSASFSIGDKSYYLSSAKDSVVYKKDPQRTIIMFFQTGGDSATINVTLWDTVPCSNRGFVILSSNGRLGVDPNADYTIHKYGAVNDFIECDFNGIFDVSNIPFSAKIKIRRRF
jgi:hypothetical protein